MSAEVVRVPFHGTYLHTLLVGDKPHVVLKPTVEGMGLDWEPQRKKLARRSWAVTSQREATGADGKTYEMVTCGLETWSMLLANIDENKVSETAKPLVIAYQRESAQALRDYWTQGGVINERATDAQLDALQQQIEERRLRRALGLVQLIAAMDDSVDPKWKRSRQLHHYAEASGETPEIAPEDRALLVETYLKDRGLTRDECRVVRSQFGRQLVAAYKLEHEGAAPKESYGLVDGRERAVKSYTEADRPLFDKVWKTFFADRYPAQQQLGGAA